jgi:hypothetical protein
LDLLACSVILLSGSNAATFFKHVVVVIVIIILPPPSLRGSAELLNSWNGTLQAAASLSCCSFFTSSKLSFPGFVAATAALMTCVLWPASDTKARTDLGAQVRVISPLTPLYFAAIVEETPT